MPDPVTGLIIGGTSLIGGAIKSSAAKKAGQIQADASMMGVEETRRQFDAMRELLKPYVDAGVAALPGLEPYLDAGTGALPDLRSLIDMAGGSYDDLEAFLGAGKDALPGLQAFAGAGDAALQEQLAITGLRGPEAQSAALAGIEGGPIFQGLVQQGEDAILQSASATGGLRGGNVQGALAQFRPQLLNSLIEQQYGRLGGIAGQGLGVNQGLVGMGVAGRESLFGQGLTGLQNLVSMGQQGQQNLVGLGQNSAAGTGNAGMSAAANIAALFGEAGAAKAGARLGSASAWGDVLSLPAKFAGLKYAGAF